MKGSALMTRYPVHLILQRWSSGGGHDTTPPSTDPPAPPVSTTISRSLNQTRTGAEATEPPSAPGLRTQTQEAGKHLLWTMEARKPTHTHTHTPTGSVTTHTHVNKHTRDEANMEEVKVTLLPWPYSGFDLDHVWSIFWFRRMRRRTMTSLFCVPSGLPSFPSAAPTENSHPSD